MKNSVLTYGSFVSGSTKNKNNVSKPEKKQGNAAERLGIFEELPEILSDKATENLLDNILDEITGELTNKPMAAAKTEIPVKAEAAAPVKEEIPETEDISEVEEVPVYEAGAVDEIPEVQSEAEIEIPSIADIMNAGENPPVEKVEEKQNENIPVEVDVAVEAETSESQDEYTEETVLDWEVPYDEFSESRDKSSKDKKQKTVKIKKEKPVKVKKEKPEKQNKQKVEKKQDSKNTRKIQKVKRPIGFVLIAIISIIVIVSLAAVTVLVSKTTTDDTLITAETNNRTQNDRAASDCESRISGVISSVEMFYYLVESTSETSEISATSSRFFNGNKDVGAVYFSNQDQKFINYQFFASSEIEASLVDSYIAQESETIDSVENGVVSVENASPFFGTSVFAIFCSFTSGATAEKAFILVSSDKIHENIANNPINLSFVVNNKGEVIVHPDISVMKQGTDFSKHPVVSKMMESGSLNEQFTYTDDEGKDVLGAYKKISTAGCAVITEVQTEIILEGVNSTIRGNIYLTIAILAISIMVIWFFSSSLSNPLKTLTAVTNEINQGNFNTELFNELSDKRKDEIGVLIRSTKAEREMLNAVTKLTNPAVTRAIVRDEIDTDAHFKDITIFFSDIRGFTSISDQFNKQYGKDSAGEIISFLNDYMARMVTCIAVTGGTVDKYEGDAIMAAWGVLRNDNLDFENLPDEDPEKQRLAEIHQSHVLEDALSAIKAGIAMRYSLMKYNKDAVEYTKNNPGKYKPNIKIGAGINTGRATVGFMGSELYKLEHSSIGDAVNLASRTESSNKLCGTDMLITQDTYDILKQKYIRCKENNFTIQEQDMADEIVVEMIPVEFEVKGKGKQHFYGVVNMPAFDPEVFFKAENTEYANPDFKVDTDCLKAVGPEGPKTLNDVRALLGIPVPDFAKVNLDAEESKVKIS